MVAKVMIIITEDKTIAIKDETEITLIIKFTVRNITDRSRNNLKHNSLTSQKTSWFGCFQK